ncbi:Na+/melibiose symporter-like transporter [Clostridium beijerinckii]|nr:Na+/melibiose symporter-like transporter [Clostridium beijerinckii]NRT48112.1 Na+/melibiose symporter-like transporter [Clostridium beijerinckii]NRZ23591.1 Na+/melibiose symporter-like transporter [Clostridium beijerinckii]
MILLSLLLLAFICINMAFYSIQSKKIDTCMKSLEKDILEEFNTIKKR